MDFILFDSMCWHIYGEQVTVAYLNIDMSALFLVF